LVLISSRSFTRLQQVVVQPGGKHCQNEHSNIVDDIQQMFLSIQHRKIVDLSHEPFFLFSSWVLCGVPSNKCNELNPVAFHFKELIRSFKSLFALQAKKSLPFKVIKLFSLSSILWENELERLSLVRLVTNILANKLECLSTIVKIVSKACGLYYKRFWSSYYNCHEWQQLYWKCYLGV